MAQTTGKLTPAELAALEHAFATDPTSNAYRPLAEAYLSMGRFMEAMVVCKKGVKAHPSSPDARILLARVYADQGKDKKAIEELKGAMGVAPNDADVLRFNAELHFKVGEQQVAADFLKKAADAKPNDEAILALAKKHNIAVAPPPPPPPPPAPPVTEAAVAAGPQTFPAGAPPPGNGTYAPGTVPGGPPAIPGMPQPVHGASAAMAVAMPHGAPVHAPAPAAQPPPRPKPRRAAVAAPAHDAMFDFSRLEEEEARVRSARSRKGLVGLVGTAVVFALALGIWAGISKWKGDRDRKISKLLEDTSSLINKDTYASYQAALKTADEILNQDSGNYVAHAYLAYVSALLWGEQGGGDDARRRAEENLKLAKGAKEQHGRIIAAEAYIKFFGGDYKGAEDLIIGFLEKNPQTKSGLLSTTLGIIQMYGGDLDKAAQTLKQAQSLEPNSVRVLAALGQLNRRRGMDVDAWTFYDSALRLDREHADSLLGKALLVLDANDVGRSKDEREKLLKEAEEQINKVLALPPGAMSARQLALGKFAQAQLFFARDKNKEAQKLEQEAFSLDPQNPDIRLLRGRRLLREGDVNGAVTEIRDAIKIDDKRASFYVDLSRALMAKPGGAKDAVEALRTALRTFPDSGRIYVLLGDAQRAVPDIDAARSSYERALEAEKGKMPEARAKLGQIWREKKDWAKARDELEKALKEFGVGATGPVVAMALTELGRVQEEGPTPDLKAAWKSYQTAADVSPTYYPPIFFLGRISIGQKDKELQKQGKELLADYLAKAPKGEHADEARKLLGR